MKFTSLTQEALAVRRDRRDRQRDGWEHVSEGGGSLWELHRGPRWDHTITEAAIAADGKGLWVKTSATTAAQTREGEAI